MADVNAKVVKVAEELVKATEAGRLQWRHRTAYDFLDVFEATLAEKSVEVWNQAGRGHSLRVFDSDGNVAYQVNDEALDAEGVQALSMLHAVAAEATERSASLLDELLVDIDRIMATSGEAA